ncbi:MAG: GHKL domain-containing protein [Oscillospiraceae bacterium]|nr:GHKL domain-containing protein [Oscillospiraceae bacterium]
MIRTLQKKFTVTAMIAVTVLLVLLLGGINLFNVLTSNADRRELLKNLAALEDFGPALQAGFPNDGDFAPGEGGMPPLGEDRDGGLFRRGPDAGDRMSALTFTVRFDAESELRSLDLSRIADLSEEEAVELARQVLSSGKSSGRIGELRYQVVSPAKDCKTVVFLDESRQIRELLRVGAISALGGLAAWFAMLLLVTALSRKAIRPIAENMERQRRFVTDAGHELKTPLAIIQANAEALELMGGESKYSRNIRAQVRRLTDLTGNLLTLARFDETAAPPDRKELDLSALTREVWESFKAPAELKKLQLQADVAEELRLPASEQQLRQLLSILLDNAVKYCPEEGALCLSLAKEDKAVLRIRNTLAQPIEHPERLFDRFYRADESRSRETGGYGIGLSAAQAIVQLHKGVITAACEDGTIAFTVRLPLS